jgi:diadenosine tetraphosphate (Ap4A) HIT family hydrolase
MSNILKDFKGKFKLNDLTIYESEHWVWSLRPSQVTIGSGILSLKRECIALSNLNENEFSDLSNIINVIEGTLKGLLGYNIMNYLMLMMVDKQVHYHVIPRYKSEVNLFGVCWRDDCWPGIHNLLGGENELELLINITNHIKKNLILIQK